MVIDKNVFNVSELSFMLGCSSQTIYKLIKNGSFRGAYKDTNGRIWKIPDDSLIDYQYQQGRKYDSIIESLKQKDDVLHLEMTNQ